MLTPLAPPPGLNNDDTAYSAAGKWADASNVRFRLGFAETIGGTSLTIAAGGSGTREMFAYRVPGAGLIPASVYLLLANAATLKTALIPTSGSFVAPSDVTPASGWNGSNGSTFAQWGNQVLIANSGGKLFIQGSTTLATLVNDTPADAPAKITAMIVTPERQVLACGCNEEISGTFNQRCIRGSDLEDYTTWATSPDNNAFEHVLDSPGDIVTAKVVGSYVAVWTTDALWMGTFIGDPGQAYRFDKIADIGAAGLHSVTALDGQAYWVSTSLRFHTWAPGTLPVEIPCPIRDEFAMNCSVENKNIMYMVTQQRRSEIWTFYPDERDGGTLNSRYLAYSISESEMAQRPVWFKGEMQRNSMLSNPVMDGTKIGTLFGSNFVGIDDEGRIAAEDCIFGDPVTPSWFIQTADQYLDAGGMRMMIKRCVPDFKSQGGDISLTLYTKDRPQSTAVMKGPFVLAAGVEKLDFRASGMIVAAKFSGSDAARFGKPVFEAVAGGGR